LPGTNTLAYYENPQIKTVKSFIVQAPVKNDNFIKWKSTFLSKCIQRSLWDESNMKTQTIQKAAATGYMTVINQSHSNQFMRARRKDMYGLV